MIGHPKVCIPHFRLAADLTSYLARQQSLGTRYEFRTNQFGGSIDVFLGRR